ncbi:hypothetical protein OBBRIDRAFT_862388 [Obba rivulosa]|uniref:Uncharacterized protein n=1 Tax=Obba rivulosa TaxID=1052685 RepID=A0A8E2DVA8_9APHY|nr:hypothetical protein OBBRIDRAFT_862388 [Obba rivulosa]
MSVVNSPLMHAQDDHLRHLLDQRAARADLHGRFPSLSEFSDSPSVYSHPHFSPRPLDRAELDANTTSFHFTVPQHNRRAPPSEPRSPMSDRERLNYPDASSLDLDDDPRASQAYESPVEDEELSQVDDEEELPRVSMYGPKMRFHSPAPWETGEDDTDSPSDIEQPSSKRSRNRADSSKKAWGLPRASSETRPSTDSTRSYPKAKHSFDNASTFSSNGGALLALAQASMSSTSLAMGPSPQSSLRDKLSLPRFRSRTPSNVNPAPDPINTRVPAFSSNSAHGSPVTRPVGVASPSDVELSPVDKRAYADNPFSQTPIQEPQGYTHPYANPDLIHRRGYDDAEDVMPSQSGSADIYVNRSDSGATLTDTTTISSMSQARSTATITPVTSVSSAMDEPSLSHRVGLQGKGISAPMPIDKSSIQPVPGSFVGPGDSRTGANAGAWKRETKLLSTMPTGGFAAWNDMPTSPSIKLISLEEAQAQARERSRSATATPSISSPFPSMTSKTHGQAPGTEQPSPNTGSRARSRSAGGKARHDVQAMASESSQRVPPVPSDTAQDQPGPHRVVNRKKSGFMKLFNAKDRERTGLYPPPPPVPSMLTDPTLLSPCPPILPRARQGSVPHRVPVPPITPSLLADVQSHDTGSSSESRSYSIGSKDTNAGQQLNVRRKAPDLTIMTTPPPMTVSKASPTGMHPESTENLLQGGVYTPTTAASRSITLLGSAPAPNSAPPGATDFVALSLRPVSTLFSKISSEHLLPHDATSVHSRPSLDTDVGTPTTSNTAISPLSPDFPLKDYPRTSDEKPGAVAIAQDDQSSVIQALQEQIVNAKRAWQRHIWELEGQVRDLKAEVEELRAAENGKEYCSACGRGTIGRHDGGQGSHNEDLKKAGVRVGVVNRPRARTGIVSRFASGT